jgi:hypothetical protein
MSNVLANSATGNAGPAAATINSVYDLFAWNNAGTCTLTRDVAWTNTTTPAAGDAIARSNGSGILTNSIAITNGPGIGYGTYLGTILTDAYQPTGAVVVAGGSSYTSSEVVTLSGGTCTVEPTFTVTESGGVVSAVTLATPGACTVVPTNPVSTTASPGSGLTLNVSWTTATVTFNPTPAAASGGPVNGAWVGLWNYYNRLLVTLTAQDNKASWAYSTNTWRASDNSNNNRATFVIGPFSGPPYVEDYISAQAEDHASGSGGATEVAVGIGVNSTTAPSGVVGQAAVYEGVAIPGSPIGQYNGLPAAGETYLQQLEDAAVASGTATWYGVNNSVQQQQLSVQSRY